jgi:hypothetical protein
MGGRVYGVMIHGTTDYREFDMNVTILSSRSLFRTLV